MMGRGARVREAGWRATEPTTAELKLSTGATMRGIVTVTQAGILVEQDSTERVGLPFEALGHFRLVDDDHVVVSSLMAEIEQIVLSAPKPEVLLDELELRRGDWWL